MLYFEIADPLLCSLCELWTCTKKRPFLGRVQCLLDQKLYYWFESTEPARASAFSTLLGWEIRPLVARGPVDEKPRSSTHRWQSKVLTRHRFLSTPAGNGVKHKALVKTMLAPADIPNHATCRLELRLGLIQNFVYARAAA